ncbi:MAG: SMI1/KNR4 family protein [Oxalobacteraceae bacterium]|nr:MAG: SMI1/KNR4 family protein [Oxalobacteraceae bacterium]
MDVSELLDKLDVLIERLPGRAIFELPASEDDVIAVEGVIGRALPEAYRAFLLRHDGGFVATNRVAREDEKALSAERWNANHLRGCDDLVREYKDAIILERDIKPDLTDWPYVPFCQTNGQETLVFGPPGPDGVHPVLDAFHEIGAAEWGVLANSFADFLALYIDGCGFPQTIALSKA